MQKSILKVMIYTILIVNYDLHNFHVLEVKSHTFLLR